MLTKFTFQSSYVACIHGGISTVCIQNAFIYIWRPESYPVPDGDINLLQRVLYWYSVPKPNLECFTDTYVQCNQEANSWKL